MLELNTSFDVINEDKELHSLVVRPYSPLFKNSKMDYSCVNITTSLLDSNKDLNSQIVSICDEYVKKILLEESNNFNSLIKELNDSLNPVLTAYIPVTSTSINFIA